ncbi:MULTISPECIES: NAD(P)H-binding protein [unclassified Streptomyces]|uniref:NAD(P)H-binding protein n=1 Tax=unclassified Streptomyces TaxID=2593676 RepID=UPI0038114ABB
MILVTGATGNVGSELVRILGELLDGTGEEVHALSRSGNPAGLPANARAVAGDLNRPETFAASLAEARAVFLMPGYDNMAATLAAARAGAAERVVLLSGGSAGASDLTNAVSRYIIESETAVRESGLPWTFLRPRMFMSNTLEWAEQLSRGDVVRAPFADVRAAVIDPYDIAACAAAALTGDDHEGQIYPLSGPDSLLPADRVRVLGEVLGRELSCEGIPDDEAYKEMSARMPVPYVDAFFSFYVDGTLDESGVVTTVREVTGREPRTFRAWAEAHADAFR